MRGGNEENPNSNGTTVLVFQNNKRLYTYKKENISLKLLNIFGKNMLFSSSSRPRNSERENLD